MKLKHEIHETEVTAEIKESVNELTLSSGKKFPLERRNLIIEGKEIPFDFFVVDSPEKWDVAAGVSGKFLMNTGQSDGHKINFEFIGLSLKQWEDIETVNPIPSPPQDDDLNEETQAKYQNDLEVALIRKRVSVLEASTRKFIPGKTIEEKAAFLVQRNPQETEKLFAHIQNVICNLHQETGAVLEQYEMFLIDSSKAPEVINFGSFEDWDTAVNAKYCFRMNRPDQDYIIEFPIKGISQVIRSKIESETREPQAPRIPKRDPATRRFDRTNIVPNYEDPSWMQSVKAVHQHRTAMYLDEALMFRIPGGNYKEKYDWISGRLVGDVLRVKRYIESEIIGLSGDLGFF